MLLVPTFQDVKREYHFQPKLQSDKVEKYDFLTLKVRKVKFTITCGIYHKSQPLKLTKSTEQKSIKIA